MVVKFDFQIQYSQQLKFLYPSLYVKISWLGFILFHIFGQIINLHYVYSLILAD